MIDKADLAELVGVRWCEACGSRVDPENCASDPDGVTVCAECLWDSQHQRRQQCRSQFDGAPFKPGRPLRVFFCGRPRGHPGSHSAHLDGAREGTYASVSWWETSSVGGAPPEDAR